MLRDHRDMEAIKTKLVKIIVLSDGYPHYSRSEYIKAIKGLLFMELTSQEVEYIKDKRINLNKWIIDVTAELTSDKF